MEPIDDTIQGSLTPKQYGAIRRSIELGKTLQQDHPDILGLWEENSLSKIVEMLEIQTRHGVNYTVAESAIRRAITGHNGGFNTSPYDGLISEEERKAIVLRHRQESGHRLYEERRGIHTQTSEELRELGRISGRKSHEEGTGIHALTSEEKRELGRKAYEEGRGIHALTSEELRELGRKSYKERKGAHSLTLDEKKELGRKAYEEGTGIHALTSEEKSIFGLKGGRKSHQEGTGIHTLTSEEKRECGRNGSIARGFTPWSDEEIELAYQLSQQPEYQRGSLVFNKLIASELNDSCHGGKEIRNARAVSIRLSTYRKSLTDKLE